MIILDVQGYCQDCSGFEPETERMRLESGGVAQSWSTVVVCTNRRKCKRMYEHIRREFFKANAAAAKLAEDMENEGIEIYRTPE